MARRVLITVGEVSGDRHAANLVRELKKLEPDIVVDALGGDALRAAGAVIHHDTVKGAAMGFRALGRAAEVRRLLAWAKEYYRNTPADLHVCVDSWSMNWHFARGAKEAGRPVLYYIAPQAWASRPGRVKRLREYVDRLACILPFEEEWFGRRGVKATFVGHPLFDHVLGDRGGAAMGEDPHPNPLPEYRARGSEGGAGPTVGLLPGSRRGIAKNNFGPLLDVAAMIRREWRGARFLIPATANTEGVIRGELARRGLSEGYGVGLDSFDEFVPRCDLCLTVSGTATLHVAAHNVPMIVVYRGSWILWNLLGRWIINARTFALVNILGGEKNHIVPEFVPWHGAVEGVSKRAIDYLQHPAKLAAQRERLAAMIATLDKPGASGRVAGLAVELMEKSTGQKAG